MKRLQKAIADSGYCSRRKAEEKIAEGKVQVNGEIITTMGYQVSDEDIIIVEVLQGTNKPYYIKSKGMTSVYRIYVHVYSLSYRL